ncbi:GFA family protein [Luteimonas sp. e5]
MSTRQGSCHCGAVRFHVQGTPQEVMECNCSHCQRKGFLLWFVPRTALSIDRGEDVLTRYTFNKHVIEHLFCPTCGVQPFGIGTRPDGSEMAAINIRSLEDIELDAIPRQPVDGRSF